MEKIYCSYCKDIVEFNLVYVQEVFNVKGEDIEIKSTLAKCKECNHEIFSEEIDESNLELVYTEYRKKHKRLFPSQIKEIREKYGLSQRALCRLLEWGEITINRYETGGLQDSVHDEVLQFISEPENMVKIYEHKGSRLAPHIREELREKIEMLIGKEIKPKFNISLEKYLISKKQINEYTGYREFDLEKAKNMILYILSYQETFRTKINKLLWYMDFSNFKKYSTSISGNTYSHFPYGPVPDDYELIIGVMLTEGIIKKDEIIRHGEVREILKPSISWDPNIFSQDEIEIMDFILSKFKKYSCGKLSEYSHKEKPYVDTVEGEQISYHLSEELSLPIE